MKRNNVAAALFRSRGRFVAIAWPVLLSSLLWAQPQQQGQYPQGGGSARPQPTTQAVSASGLLPVYGIDLRADKTWIDGQFPSQSRSFSNSGVNGSFQAAWDSLKAGGYNILRVPVDVRDAQSASRVANLCAWGKNNNVKILILLSGATDTDYAGKAASLITRVISTLRNSQSADSYLQIAAYQLDDEINHPGMHGQAAASLNQRLSKAAESIRAAEREALEGSGAEPTPLMASASFDYELIQAKAIAGVPFSDATYQQAYSSLISFLQPLAQSPNVDLLSVSWFPGTVSAGSVDKPPQLLRSLASDLPGKQIVFTTGFSTAFSSPEDQKNYYTLTFANVGDLRATAGGDSSIVGVIFREALNGKNPREPRGAAEQMKKWNWSAKADELTAMWTGKSHSEDMKWWWEKVQNNMGLASFQPVSGGAAEVTPLPAQQAMGQIATVVSETNAAAGPYPQYPGQDQSSVYQANGSYPAGSNGAQPASSPGQGSSNFKDALQARMVALLDAVIQRIGASQGMSNTSGYGGSSCYPGSGNASCSSTGQYPGTYPSDPSAGPYPQGAQYPGQYPDTSQYPNTQGYPQGQYPQPGQYPNSTQQYPAQYPSGSQYPNQYPSGGTTGGTGYPGSAAGAAPASIVISQQDTSVQPTTAQAGQPVNIAAKVRNQGPTDVSGLIVFASDASNTILAQADNVHVPHGSVAPLTMQFVPVDAQNSLALVLHVSDPFGNEVASAPLAPISVSPMPAGASGAGTGSSSGFATDPGSSSGSSGSGGFGKLVGPIGIARVAMIPLHRFLVAGDAVPMMANVSNPFGIPMRNVHATLLIDGVVSQSQTISMLLPRQSRSLLFPNVVVKKPGTHEVRIVVQSQRGNAKPQVANLVGKMTFLPAKSRIPMAHTPSGGVIPHTGVAGSAGSSAAAPRVRSIISPGFTSSTSATVRPPALGQSQVKPAQQTQVPSTGIKPSLNARSMTQGGAATSNRSPSLYARSATQPAGTATGTRVIGSSGTPTTTTSAGTGPQPSGGSTTTTSGYRPMGVVHPFVSVNPNEISYGPPAPKPGQPITFSVIVRNAAETPAPRVSLVLRLYADGKLVAATQQPILFSVGPRSGFRATWQAGMPWGRQVQLVAAVAAEGDSNANGKQTSIQVRTGGPPPSRVGTMKVQH